MLVQDVLDIVKIRSDNVALSRNDKALIQFIYLGLTQLYKRFTLSIKHEAIETNPEKPFYELRNEDVAMLLYVYDIDGKELKDSDVVDGREWDIKRIGHRGFLLNNPEYGFVYAVYSADPPRIQDGADYIDIPYAMLDALLCYVTYMIHSTVTSTTSVLGRGSSLEATDYYQKFLQACQELEMQGFKCNVNAETLSVAVKGYK